MTWGTAEYQSLFKAMRADGNVHPQDKRKPALKRGDRRYYDAFRSLSASRMWNQVGPTPLRLSEIHHYLQMAGIETPETKLKYLRLMQGMDAVELKCIQDKKAK